MNQQQVIPLDSIMYSNHLVDTIELMKVMLNRLNVLVQDLKGADGQPLITEELWNGVTSTVFNAYAMKKALNAVARAENCPDECPSKKEDICLRNPRGCVVAQALSRSMIVKPGSSL